MRKKKTYISALNGDSGQVVSQENKSRLAHSHFSNILGATSTRTSAINWSELGYAPHDLEDLDAPFTKQKLETMVKDMLAEKAPGPDSFIGIFYKKCWSIIKGDLFQAVMSFYNHQTTMKGP